jgi:hypothetical protein
MHSDRNRIPRWLVENDPSWERSIDSDLRMLKWTKKGTKVQVVCHPTAIFCEIVDQTSQATDLSDIMGITPTDKHALRLSGIEDITKYLSSRYLNPRINGVAEFDLKRPPKW